MKPHYVLLVLIGIAILAALIKLPLSPCPASFPETLYQCHARDIGNFSLIWMLALAIFLPISSLVYQYQKIRHEGRKPSTAFIRYLGAALVAVGAEALLEIVVITLRGWRSQNIDDEWSIVLFSGDAGLIFIFLKWIVVAWVVLITIIAAFTFYSNMRT